MTSRGRTLAWVGAAVAALGAIAVVFVVRARQEDALFRRALSKDGEEARAAREEIERDPRPYADRIAALLESGGQDEVTLAVNASLGLQPSAKGAEWLVRMSHGGTPWRRLGAAVILWFHGLHPERLRAVSAEFLKEGDFEQEYAFVWTLGRIRVDPPHDREAAEMTLAMLDDVYRKGRTLTKEQKERASFLIPRFAVVHEPHAEPLLRARIAAGNALPWHQAALGQIGRRGGSPR
jgi:hypothetical protein